MITITITTVELFMIDDVVDARIQDLCDLAENEDAEVNERLFAAQWAAKYKGLQLSLRNVRQTFYTDPAHAERIEEEWNT